MLYRGTTICYATKHRKENQSRRLIRAALGAELYAPPSLNTDTLGTFTGETPRTGKPTDVVKKKCLMGLEASGLSIGIANEGSFGPHPHFPFTSTGREIICFIDRERDIEIYEHDSFCKTNHFQALIEDEDSLNKALEDVGFPNHSVILRPTPTSSTDVYKGIKDVHKLNEAFEKCRNLSSDGKVSVESDMRAHHNLTRRHSLIKLTRKLVQRLLTACPHCETPGWGKTGIELGLPCGSCSMKTLEIKHHIFNCSACRYEEKVAVTQKLADPKHCSFCNP